MSKIQTSPCRACDDIAKKLHRSSRTKSFTAQTDITVHKTTRLFVNSPSTPRTGEVR